MKNYLFLTLLVGLLMACEKEALNVTNLDGNEEEMIQARRMQPPSGTTGTGLITCGNNISYLSSLNPISGTSIWWPLPGSNPSVNYLHDELDEAFHCSPYFSTCTIRPSHPPVSVDVVEFQLADNGRVEYDILLGEVIIYDDLPSNVSISKGEELKEHFACTIKDYQNNNYSTSTYIHKVEFRGDALLCTCPSGKSHFLTATVTFNTY